ncbi:MAG TPA: nuclear transport factor 2 family protein, partial [Acidimicrobiia bacterium]|nr:nuclear transport factor 2 family protein [Acidimicrobiia bacterium]
ASIDDRLAPRRANDWPLKPGRREGGRMIDSGDGMVEQTFEHLAARDWDSFGALLATDVERIGPFGERVVGRDAYVELMAAGVQRGSDDGGDRTTWDVHRVVYAHDGRSAFARVTAHVPHGGRELRIE